MNRIQDLLRSPRARGWLYGLLLVGATILAYQPAWHGGFIWDDDVYVVHNQLLSAPGGLQRIWFSLDSPSQYFPLTYTTLRFEHHLWGLNTTGYHWVNLLLHAANALLVWRLLARLTVPGAWLAAGFFALHPIQVESVAWITELKNVQSLFFCLLALLAWVEFVEQRARRRWVFYALALGCYVLALSSKSVACTLPAALLLILWLKHLPITRWRLAQVLPFLGLGLVTGLVAMWWERYHQGTQGEVFGFGLLERVLVASRAVWFYAGKLLWPANLAFSYAHWKIDPADPLAYAWLAAGVAVVVAICLARRVAGRGVEVAALFYVATLAPMLGFIMLYTFHYTFVADHYQYAASIGLFALAAAGVARVRWGGLRRSTVLPALTGLSVLVVLWTLTRAQSGTYKDIETLWRATIAGNPQAEMAYVNLGAMLLDSGRLDEALPCLQKAVELQPDDADALQNLGLVLYHKGRLDESLPWFQQAIACNPRLVQARFNLGRALLDKGRVDEALVQLQAAVEAAPGMAAAGYHLGRALLAKGREEEAVALFQRAIELQPNLAEAHGDLAGELFRKGRVDEAIAHFRIALELQPGYARTQYNFGSVLLQRGQPDEAAAHFRKALEIRPDYAEAHNNLAMVLLQKGQLDEAITHFQKAIEIQPANAAAHFNLAILLLDKGQPAEAADHLKKALELRPDFPEARHALDSLTDQKHDNPANPR